MKINTFLAFLLSGILGCKKENNPQISPTSEPNSLYLELTLVEAMSYKKLATRQFKIVKHFRTKVGRSESSTIRSVSIGSVMTDKNGVLKFSYLPDLKETGWIEITDEQFRFRNICALNQSVNGLFYNDTIGLIDIHFNSKSKTANDTLYVESSPGKADVFPINSIHDGYAFTTSRFKTYGNKDTIVFAFGYQRFVEAIQKQRKGVNHNDKVIFEVRGWPHKEIVLLDW